MLVIERNIMHTKQFNIKDTRDVEPMQTNSTLSVFKDKLDIDVMHTNLLFYQKQAR